MCETNLKGALTEQRCFTKCLESGYMVLKPLFDDSKYDFVLDLNGKLIRVQVKTSRWANEQRGVFIFSCSGCHNKKKYTNDEVDYIMTEMKNKFFLFPVYESGVYQKTLNIDDNTYLFENVIQMI